MNKAADDAKNRRSVLSYLRGEQKDGSANRGNCDFCSVIALEIEDTGTHITTCVGIAFEVRKMIPRSKSFPISAIPERCRNRGILRRKASVIPIRISKGW